MASPSAGLTPAERASLRWTHQIARNLTDCVDGFLRKKRFLILDRDGKFSDAFRGVLEDHGIEMVLCPARAPIRLALQRRAEPPRHRQRAHRAAH